MNFGVFMIILFVAAAAARDVIFGGLFQQHTYFLIVFVAFGLAMVTAVIAVGIWQPDQFKKIRVAWREAALTNLGTAGAWLSFFYALKVLEPAIVHTIHIGVGSMTLIFLGVLGIHSAAPAKIRGIEVAIQLAILAILVALAAIVLMGLSGLPVLSTGQSILGIFLAAASGVIISVTTDISKRMNERGVSAGGVLASRFTLIVLVAGIALSMTPSAANSIATARDLWVLLMASLVLIVMPTYALHVGLARTSAVSAWILMALGPCLVFVGQFFDGRLSYSPFTLACIIGYSVLAIASNLVREFEKPAPGRRIDDAA